MRNNRGGVPLPKKVARVNNTCQEETRDEELDYQVSRLDAKALEIEQMQLEREKSQRAFQEQALKSTRARNYIN